MSVNMIFYEGGHKMARPITTESEYRALRDDPRHRQNVAMARQGFEGHKKQLLQFNYGLAPNRNEELGMRNEEFPLKGANKPGNSVGMDIDLNENDNHNENENHAIRDRILARKEELGILMLERSVTKGYHVVFRRRPELTNEENLQWMSKELGVEYDKAAKDITRVFFATTNSTEDLIYLHDDLFSNEELGMRNEELIPSPEHKVFSNTNNTNLANEESPEIPNSRDPEIPNSIYPHLKVRLLGEDYQSSLCLRGPNSANKSSLRAFDLCVEAANLKPEEMDVWGEHNWHTNLMSVLSVGLPKLMSREQLKAVVAERLPNYSQTDDCQKLIAYFYDNYTADKGFMSTKLREINAKAQRAAETPSAPDVSEDDKDLATLCEGWNPPPLPKRLPRLMQLLLKPYPEQYHPMLVIAALVVLGAIASHFRTLYLDGRVIGPNLYAALIAGSGKGKNWVTMLFERMCKNTIRTWDDAEWRKVYENQEMRDKMQNAKDRPAKYHPRFRVMETMSKTSLLEVQTNLGENGMVLCNYTESDELANSSKVAFSNLSVLLRKAWDLGTHRQFYMTEASCNTQCKLNAAILLTGTPKSVLSRLFADTENGMMQRFIPMIMPKVKRSFRPPKFVPLTPDEEAEMDGLLLTLWQKDLSLGEQTLTLDLPKTTRMVEEWYDALEERYNDGLVTEAEADLSHRVGQFMMRGALPFVALYGDEPHDMTDLMRWVGDFSYYNIVHIFGRKVGDEQKEADELLQQRTDARRTAAPLLSQLPEVFSMKQFKELRVKLGQSPESRNLLSRYVESHRLVRIGKGVYQQVREENNISVS